MQTLIQIAELNGYKYRHVSDEEYEDGGGATVGDNFTKGQLWFTQDEMLNELGLPPMSIKTAILDSTIGKAGARQAAIIWLKNQPDTVSWYNISYLKYTHGGEAIKVTVQYGKD